ncbi:MAG: CARDB domain-containing protein [Candidatus Bathyarchaeia archaeon]
MKTRTAFFKLAIIGSLMITLLTIPHLTFSQEDFTGNVDLFTQKTPFSGIGPNNPSDAFAPQELVILYARVTFNKAPISNNIVGFQADGPINAIQNITLIGAATTNVSGIAEFSFRMPIPPVNAEETIFGEWHAIATVEIDQVVVNDTLTFRAGWIITIKSIATLNDKLSPQTDFTRQSTVVFNLTLENIAFTPKPAAITIDTQDGAGHPIMHTELDNLTIPPGESNAQASSTIPENATLGEENASATPFTSPPTSGGTPYSPSVYTTFNIVTTVEEHDVAITGVNPSTTQAYVGQSVEITVEAANLGDFSETFNVTVYYDTNPIQVIPVISLLPHSSKTITVEWNTANVSPGVYTISANATIVEGDVNPSNNNFVDGRITIISAPPPFAPSGILLTLILAGLGILAGLAFLILLLAHYSRKRKRKTRRAPQYVIIVHPHI